MADNANRLKMWQEAASAGKDCLPLETLEKLAENASADAKAAAHLSGCAHCQTELAMLKSFEAATPTADEGAAVAWIATQLQRRQAAPARPSSDEARVPFWRNLFRVPYLAGAAALAVVLALGISLLHQDSGNLRIGGPSTGIIYRGEIKLVAPMGNLDQAPNQFRWEAVPGAASYTVELTDVLNKPLASATSSQPELAATPEMKASIRSGIPLKWKVTAFDASGKSITESSGGSFKVKQ
jgi:hypothetical protein